VAGTQIPDNETTTGNPAGVSDNVTAVAGTQISDNETTTGNPAGVSDNVTAVAGTQISDNETTTGNPAGVSDNVTAVAGTQISINETTTENPAGVTNNETLLTSTQTGATDSGSSSVALTTSSTSTYVMSTVTGGSTTEAPYFHTPVKQLNLTDYPGTAAILQCDPHGSPTPDVTWSLPPGVQGEVSNGSLLLRSITANNTGIYTCTARNRAGEANFTVVVDVKEHDPVVATMKSPESDVTSATQFLSSSVRLMEILNLTSRGHTNKICQSAISAGEIDSAGGDVMWIV
ncbi:hypothetical protein BaRGS_00018824, partial [Batillaria attramentaria]